MHMLQSLSAAVASCRERWTQMRFFPHRAVLAATATVAAWLLLGDLVGGSEAVLGWAYFTAWSVSFYPQIVQNWRRRR